MDVEKKTEELLKESNGNKVEVIQKLREEEELSVKEAKKIVDAITSGEKVSGDRPKSKERCCSNCGERLESEWQACPNCGITVEECLCGNNINSIQNTQEIKGVYEHETKDEYLIFTKFHGKGRRVINTLFKILSWLVNIGAVLVTLVHISSEIQAAENYKMLLYIIRLCYSCGLWYVWAFIVGQVHNLMEMKRDRVIERESCKTVVQMEVSYIVLGMLGWGFFLSPSDGELLKIFGAVAFGSVWDFLMIIKIPILLWLIAGVLRYILDSKFLKETKNKKDNKKSSSTVNNK